MLKSNFVSLLRRIRRAPLPAIMTLATIAIGVGANTAVFSVIDGILLKPSPYPQPERLVSVVFTAPGLNIKELYASPSTYFVFREQSLGIAAFASYFPSRRAASVNPVEALRTE